MLFRESISLAFWTNHSKRFRIFYFFDATRRQLRPPFSHNKKRIRELMCLTRFIFQNNQMSDQDENYLV